MGIPSVIRGLLGNPLSEIKDLVDEIFTNGEEKQSFLVKMEEIETNYDIKVLEVDGEFARARSAVLTAEAQSESWLTRTWRPILMMIFAGLIVSIAFGWADAENLTAVPDRLWSIMMIGIGGYIFGRSWEKDSKLRHTAGGK